MKAPMVFAFLVILGSQGCDDGRDLPKTEIDLQPFISLTENAGCDNIANRLFLIDEKLVFWDVRGDCPDGSYVLILYKETVNDTLCVLRDSIAGPQGYCSPSHQDMFETITNNLDSSRLGLGGSHTVERIEF